MPPSRERVQHLLSGIFWKTADLLFPPFCIQCGKLGDRICSNCRVDIEWIRPPICSICGSPLNGILQHSCIDPEKIRQIRSAAIFSGPVRKALHAIKYRNDQSLAGELAQFCLPFWPLQDWGITTVTPVPLGKRRERERGYNQSMLLARAISEHAQIPLKSDLIYRVRETRSQVGLNYQERQTNLRDAFASAPANGQRVVLVDDVCTTGATMQMCALALRQAGAECVFGVSVARAMM